MEHKVPAPQQLLVSKKNLKVTKLSKQTKQCKCPALPLAIHQSCFLFPGGLQTFLHSNLFPRPLVPPGRDTVSVPTACSTSERGLTLNLRNLLRGLILNLRNLLQVRNVQREELGGRGILSYTHSHQKSCFFQFERKIKTDSPKPSQIEGPISGQAQRKALR